MASPQKERGYTPIANELLEAIYSAQLNATQLKVVLVVARYTYGFSRKKHHLSLNFIAKGTGISRRYISAALQSLIANNIITVVAKHTDTKARLLALNKNYDEWFKGGSKLLQVKDCSTGEETDNTTGEQSFNTTGEELFNQDKQNIKQNIKQGDSHPLGQTEISNKAAADLFELLWQQYPRKKGKGQVSDTQKRKLLKIGRAHLERCVGRFLADMEREGRPVELYPYGSTFFNSGFIDYTDENYQEDRVKNPRPAYLAAPEHKRLGSDRR